MLIKHGLPFAFACWLALAVAGCSSSDKTARLSDPIAASRQTELSPAERVDAIQEAKAEVAAGKGDAQLLRLSMKELAWSLDTPEVVRAAALEALLWDEIDPADSEKLVEEMLPTEPSRQAVAVMSTAVADHAWKGTTPALVRSLARPVAGVPDGDRSEYKALLALYPDQDVQLVILGVFLDPRTDPGPAGLALDMRVREAAWTLLGRLSPDPGSRARLLEEAPEGDAGGAELLGKIRVVRDALGVLPDNGEELRWALRLYDERESTLRAWWEQTAAAVATLGPDERRNLAVRHLEAVRWAAEARPEWLRTDRAGLLTELEGRLRGRTIYPRTESVRGNASALSERLSAAKEMLPWGDVLAILVIDTAIAEGPVDAACFEAADVDHKDTTTEHGGTLWSDARGFHMQRFPPRGSAAPDDRRFTAPREMIEYSSAALAHFHFHVAASRNREFAGPSPEDLDYAARFGRTCMVLTSLSADSLDVDVYFPSGAIVDLSSIRRPAERP